MIYIEQKIRFFLVILSSFIFNIQIHSQAIDPYIIDPNTCPYANSNKGYQLYDFRYIGSGKVCFRYNYIKCNKCAVAVYDLKTHNWKPVICTNGQFLNYCSNGSDFIFATNEKVIQVKIKGKKSVVKILSTGQFKTFSLSESPNWLLIFNKNNRILTLYETKLNKKSFIDNFELPSYYSFKNLYLLPNKTIIGTMKSCTPNSLQKLWIKPPYNKTIEEIYLNLPLYSYDAENNDYKQLSDIQLIYCDIQCQQLLLQSNYESLISKISNIKIYQSFKSYQEFFNSQIPINNMYNQNKKAPYTNKLLNIDKHLYHIQKNNKNQLELLDLGKCITTLSINAPLIIRDKFPLFAIRDECYFFSEQSEKNKIIKKNISEILKGSDLEEVNIFSKANLNLHYVGQTAVLSSVSPDNKVLMALFNLQNQ